MRQSIVGRAWSRQPVNVLASVVLASSLNWFPLCGALERFSTNLRERFRRALAASAEQLAGLTSGSGPCPARQHVVVGPLF